MSLIERWASVLKDIREEFSISPLPLKKGKFARHYFAIKPTIRDLSVDNKELATHLQTYQELLNYCRQSMQKKNRAHAIATIRYLESCWLPTLNCMLPSFSPVD